MAVYLFLLSFAGNENKVATEKVASEYIVKWGLFRRFISVRCSRFDSLITHLFGKIFALMLPSRQPFPQFHEIRMSDTSLQ